MLQADLDAPEDGKGDGDNWKGELVGEEGGMEIGGRRAVLMRSVRRSRLRTVAERPTVRVKPAPTKQLTRRDMVSEAARCIFCHD